VLVTAGSKIGPYEIVGALGAGGMGEVYRARDPRIGRHVALKILPPAFAASPERMRRFEQEARAAGAVSHPNLLAVFDVGTQDGLPFIVSELLEGTTLGQRLARGDGGTLPPRKAVEYAVQIARGLAAAHEKGIIHRDLKPDNIFVTDDERVKLLDFGLAKLIPNRERADSSKVTEQNDTAEGVIMGTFVYMSPEQVRAQSVDHRTDIFSFGVVLYEMLCGTRPFDRPSQVDTMAAILNDEPLAFTRPVPIALQRTVLHALEKLPANRFQSMRDAVFALDTFSGMSEAPSITVKTRGRSRDAKKGEASSARYRRITFRRGFVTTARFASDGSVIYGATWEDQPQDIYSVLPGNPESRPSGLPNADVLAVSPSGELALLLRRRFVGGWVTSGTLARGPLFGGAPRELLNDVQEADWTPDGKQLAVIRHTRDGHAVDLPLGTTIYESSRWISNLRVSPRGERIAFLEHPLWGDSGGSIVILDRAGQRLVQSRALNNVGGLAWTPNGDEVWVAGEQESSFRSFIGFSSKGKERIVLGGAGWFSVHDIASDGRVLYSVENARREIVAATRGGDRQRNLAWLDWSQLRGLSPDGSRILFEEQLGGRRANAYTVYVRKTDGSPAVRLGEGNACGFSPDGDWIAIKPTDADYLDLVPIGVGTTRRVRLHGIEEAVWWDWTADGLQMVLWGHEASGPSRHFAVSLKEDAPPRPISPEGSKWLFATSPDSQQLVTVTADGRLTIVSLATGETRPVEGQEEGDGPLQWSEDGRSIFVFKPGRIEVIIDRIDLASGQRTQWQRLRPDDPAGILDIFPIRITRDGSTYAYSYRRFLSDLYVIDGVL
jgi:eukaryotic-like serine/threonine-protein kinase